MDLALIKNWNETVSKEDRVFYLGDLAFGKGSMHYVEDYTKILNGNIVFIKGNHYDPRIAKQEPLRLEYNGHKFVLCHWPEKLAAKYSPEKRGRTWLLHGHWHGNDLEHYPFFNGRNKTVNVSVELTAYKPIDMDYICKLIEEEVGWMDTIVSEPVYAVNALRARAT